jgi:hypothetical protein
MGSLRSGPDQVVRIGVLPRQPGEYEIRFVNMPAAGRQIYASRPLTIR